jgi:glutamyl-tRNA synthetase
MLPFLEEAGLASARDLEDRHEWFLALVPLVSERVKRLNEIVPWVRFLFTEEIAIDAVTAETILAKEGSGLALAAAYEALASLAEWSSDAIEQALRRLPEALEIKPRALFQVVRAAVAGSTVSPPLFESLALLRREVVLARLKTAQSLSAP